MFGFLKSLRGKPSEEKHVPAPAPKPSAAPPPPAPRPVPAAAAPAAIMPLVDAAPVETVALSAKAIVKALPEEVRAKVQKTPSDTVMAGVPLPLIATQLPKGAVKISFGDLRRCMPGGIFADGADLDETVLDLPLAEILARLKPGQMPVRAGRKRVEIPEDITPIFGNRGEAFKGPIAAMPTASATAAPAAPAPAPVPAMPAATAIQMAPPPAPPLPEAPIRMAALPKPEPPPSPRPAAPAAPASPAVKPLGAADAGSLRIAINDLANAGNAELKEALKPMEGGFFDIPAGRLEEGIKKGKAVFTWEQLKDWVRGAAADRASLSPEAVLELPLKVVAPLFLAAKKPVLSQKKYVVAENIPNLFTSQGSLSTPTAPPAPAPAAPPVQAAASEAVIEKAALPAKPAEPDYGDIFGQPGKKDWSPKEIVEKIANFGGVAGALLATGDGLLVAAQLSKELNGETVAAFIPQMFTRIVQYTRELKLGEPPHITLTIENVPLQMFKAGETYLTVLGRAGETLPKTQLLAVAARLARPS